MIYLDNAATTRIRDEVLDEMLPFLKDEYGNPSALYSAGREARRAVEQARERVAAALGAASPKEIYFTSSGTEADNWALRKYSGRGRIVTDAAEHHAILNTAKDLKARGRDVHILRVDKYGMVSPRDIGAVLKDGGGLVSVMAVNNEVGTINPIHEIAATAKAHGAVVHTDAVQAVGHMQIDVKTLGVDMMSVSAHKFYGPKGVGALYVKGGTPLNTMITGGAQERGRRAGTENVASIVGMGKAIELIDRETERNIAHENSLGKRLCDRMLREIPGARLNGHPLIRVWGNVSFSFESIRTETLLVSLDQEGIACSGGSACAAGSVEPSHVLIAMGGEGGRRNGALRFSIGRYNTVKEIDETVEALKEIIFKIKK